LLKKNSLSQRNLPLAALTEQPRYRFDCHGQLFPFFLNLITHIAIDPALAAESGRA